MTLHLALATSALVASFILALVSAPRILGGLAVLASLIGVATVTGFMRITRLHLWIVPLALLLPALIAVPGLVAWFRATSKSAVSAAAIVTFVGALQVALYLTSRL